jgi:hypothetical protein
MVIGWYQWIKFTAVSVTCLEVSAQLSTAAGRAGELAA